MREEDFMWLLASCQSTKEFKCKAEEEQAAMATLALAS